LPPLPPVRAADAFSKLSGVGIPTTFIIVVVIVVVDNAAVDAAPSRATLAMAAVRSSRLRQVAQLAFASPAAASHLQTNAPSISASSRALRRKHTPTRVGCTPMHPSPALPPRARRGGAMRVSAAGPQGADRRSRPCGGGCGGCRCLSPLSAGLPRRKRSGGCWAGGSAPPPGHCHRR
jgi:hypothetical protein